MTNPDFVKLAESMNVKGLRAESLEDLPAKMKEFLEYDGSKPILLEAWVDKQEHVLPMIPAGHALHQPVVRSRSPLKETTDGRANSFASLSQLHKEVIKALKAKGIAPP